MDKHTVESQAQLMRAGIDSADAQQLRRISMTLHRWHELECGTDGGCVERDDQTGLTYFRNAHTGRRWLAMAREART